MAINLVKGQNAKLDNINLFHIGLGWDVRVDSKSDEEFDLDVSAFMIGANKKTPSEDYLIFYNSENRLKVDRGELVKPLKIVKSSMWDDNKKLRTESRPVDPEISVIGSIDDEDGTTSDGGDDETMDIDLSKVSEKINEIIICVSIYEWEKRHQNFGQVEHAYVRLYRPGKDAMGQEEYLYDLTEDFSADHSVEFIRLYRHGGDWKIQALGIGHHEGLEGLVQKFM